MRTHDNKIASSSEKQLGSKKMYQFFFSCVEASLQTFSITKFHFGYRKLCKFFVNVFSLPALFKCLKSLWLLCVYNFSRKELLRTLIIRFLEGTQHLSRVAKDQPVHRRCFLFLFKNRKARQSKRGAQERGQSARKKKKVFFLFSPRHPRALLVNKSSAVFIFTRENRGSVNRVLRSSHLLGNNDKCSTFFLKQLYEEPWKWHDPKTDGKGHLPALCRAVPP